MELVAPYIGYLCIGLVLLGILNLLLELLGISIFGGERKPGFLLRLILIIILAGAIGWAFCTYVVDMPFYQDNVGECSHCDGNVAADMVEDAADITGGSDW